MKTRISFPWRRATVEQERPAQTAQPATEVPTLWLKNRPAMSLLSQEIAQRQLRDKMERVERRMQACPIAPLQEQMQTVWFGLVHEYLKNKREGGRI